MLLILNWRVSENQKKFVFLTRSTPQRRQGGCGAVEANRTLPLVNEIAGAPMSQKTESAAQTLVESLGPIPGLTYFSRRFHCEECEIAQELEVAFRQSPDAFLCAEKCAAYLKRAARNKAIDLWKKQRRFRKAVPLDETQFTTPCDRDDFAILEEEERRSQLHEAIERLPKIYRDIVFACSINRVRLEKYAKSAGIHVECAKSRLRRAHDRLASDSYLRDLFCRNRL